MIQSSVNKTNTIQQNYKLILSRPAVFCATTVTNPLEMIGPPKFQRLRNRIPWGCRKLVQRQTHKRTTDIRVLTTPKTIRIFQRSVIFQELDDFLWTNFYWTDLGLQVPKRHGFTMITPTHNSWNTFEFRHLSKWLQAITSLHSVLNVISLTLDHLKKNFGLLTRRKLGRCTGRSRYV